ncbi:unnamed protein product [Leptidea sinapis]|uniref:Sushi domain-containing protein n=1 Tax=Leptidea sinapis TaxID=189913 RepID=A0A5E4QZS2_9NEOP|nr:unnamed protein product [Leptidea sinapis]
MRPPIVTIQISSAIEPESSPQLLPRRLHEDFIIYTVVCLPGYKLVGTATVICLTGVSSEIPEFLQASTV